MSFLDYKTSNSNGDGLKCAAVSLVEEITNGYNQIVKEPVKVTGL